MTDSEIQPTTVDQEKTYRALILTVGAQGEQVVFCIQQHQPDYVALLGTNTEQCRTAIDEVQRRVQIPATRLRIYDTFPDNPRSIGDVIHAFYRAYRWLTRQQHLQPNQIAVDPTGGRKWMSAGLTMIASFLDLPIIYVHKDYADQTPMTIVSVGNAFQQLGFLEAARADEEFNSGHYQAAAEKYQILAARTPDIAKARLNETKKNLAIAYDAWSKFRFMDAYQHMSQVVGTVDQFNRNLPQLYPCFPILKQQQDILNVLRRNDENRSQYVELLRDQAFTQHIMLTLQAQHRRDAADGRFEHAVILVYRILELLSQWRLALQHIDTENIPENIRSQYEQPFRELSGSVYRERGGRAVPTRAALTDGWLLLYCMGDELVRPEIAAGNPVSFFNRMIGQLTARNLLWIEHRNNLMDGDRYQTFAQFAETFINRFFPEDRYPREPYRFIALPQSDA